MLVPEWRQKNFYLGNFLLIKLSTKIKKTYTVECLGQSKIVYALNLESAKRLAEDWCLDIFAVIRREIT